MNKLIVTSRQATNLKALGFKEKCWFHYGYVKAKTTGYELVGSSKVNLKNWNKIPHTVSAPLHQQAIQFLLESIGGLVSIEIFKDGSGSWHFEKNFFEFQKVNFQTIPNAINLGIEHLQSIQIPSK